MPWAYSAIGGSRKSDFPSFQTLDNDLLASISDNFIKRRKIGSLRQFAKFDQAFEWKLIRFSPGMDGSQSSGALYQNLRASVGSRSDLESTAEHKDKLVQRIR